MYAMFVTHFVHNIIDEGPPEKSCYSGSPIHP